MRALELKIPPVVMVLIVGALMFGCSRYLPTSLIDPSFKTWLLWSIIIISLSIAMAAIVSFKQAQTTVNPTTPTASSSLVSSGIYHYTRNPMYLAMAFLLFGWCIYLSNLYLVIFVAGFVYVMNKLQIEPEERALEIIFSDQFIQYKQQVRRWL